MMNNLLKYLTLTLILTLQLSAADSLKLIHPNGGEVFEVGTTTDILWEGVPDTSSVTIKFSSNNGNTWNVLFDSTDGISEQWEIPDIESDSCLVMVKKKDIDTINNNINVDWIYSYHESNYRSISDIVETKDGGFIVTGSERIEADSIQKRTRNDLLVMRLDANGKLIWSKTYGGSESDYGRYIIETRDSDILIAGKTWSSNGDLNKNYGSGDIWILKLDKKGNKVWSKTFGGSMNENPKSIIQTSAGETFVFSSTSSKDFDLPPEGSSSRPWVLKLDDDGNIISNFFIEKSSYFFRNVIETEEGDLIIVGYDNGSYDEDGNSNNNIWLTKYNSNFERVWSQYYDLILGDDEAKEIYITKDKSIVLIGASLLDILIVKLNSSGEMEWNKTFGGTDIDGVSSISETINGTFLILGTVYSDDGDVSNFNGSADIWMFELDRNGELIWEQTIGGTEYDYCSESVTLSDGSHVLSGGYASKTGLFADKFEGKSPIIFKISKSNSEFQTDTSEGLFKIKNYSSAGIKKYFIYDNNESNSATITVDLEEETEITIEVYDMNGIEIENPFSGLAKEGRNEFKIEYNDFQSGRYFVRLSTPEATKTEIIEVIR